MADRPNLRTSRSANLTANKQLKAESEPKADHRSSKLSSQKMATQAASKQLTSKPSTPNPRQKEPLGQDKTLKDELSGSGRKIRSSVSVPDLSESKNLPTAQKSCSTAVRPTTIPTPTRLSLSRCTSAQKKYGTSQNKAIKKSTKEENEVSDLASSTEVYNKKLKGARAVSSRFREAAATRKKVVNKGHEKSSGPELKRLNAAKKNIALHSTGIEESMLMPSLDWDLSVMKPEISPVEVPECTGNMESALNVTSQMAPILSEEDNIEQMDFDELLFSYMTIKRENSLEKYQDDAERNLLLLEEQNKHLRREIFEYKQEYIMREKKKQLRLIIEQQMELLKQVVPCLKQFKVQYKSLGQALDATRHSLPVQNIYMSENPREDLAKLKIDLETTQQLLNGLRLGVDKENSNALAVFKELGVTVENTVKEMRSFFRNIEEVASFISRETALIHQELDEEVLGMDVSVKGIFK